MVESRSIERHVDVLFEPDHDGVWFYLALSFNGEDVVIDTGTLNNLVPHPDDMTRLIPVPHFTVRCLKRRHRNEHA